MKIEIRAWARRPVQNCNDLFYCYCFEGWRSNANTHPYNERTKQTKTFSSRVLVWHSYPKFEAVLSGGAAAAVIYTREPHAILIARELWSLEKCATFLDSSDWFLYSFNLGLGERYLGNQTINIINYQNSGNLTNRKLHFANILLFFCYFFSGKQISTE